MKNYFSKVVSMLFECQECIKKEEKLFENKCLLQKKDKELAYSRQVNKRVYESYHQLRLTNESFKNQQDYSAKLQNELLQIQEDINLKYNQWYEKEQKFIHEIEYLKNNLNEQLVNVKNLNEQLVNVKKCNVYHCCCRMQ